MSCSSPVRDSDAAFPVVRRATIRTLHLPGKGSPLLTNHNSANKPMLHSDANWLRWRRLAKASFSLGAFTRGSKYWAKPKYWIRAITQLVKAAINQVLAITVGFSAERHINITPMHIKLASQGKTAGEGPGARGLIQGKRLATKSPIPNTERCLQSGADATKIFIVNLIKPVFQVVGDCHVWEFKIHCHR